MQVAMASPTKIGVTRRRLRSAKHGRAEREATTLMRVVWNDDPIVGCGRWGILFPEAFSCLHLGRLIVKHRSIKDVPDKKLTRQGHGCETDAERDCAAPKGFMFAAQ
jgi:hypothetical protein